MKARDMMESGKLVWFHEDGVGFIHPGEESFNYGQDYFDEYQKRAQNEISGPLMDLRRLFVKRYHHGPLVDVGPGSGTFIEHWVEAGEPPIKGYDVNPFTVSWLIARGIFWNPAESTVPAATFWDVLEHFNDPALVVRRVTAWVFVSIPIFEGPEHIQKSKHRKPGEHIWYFSEPGLVKFFDAEGFDLAGKAAIEMTMGREGIGTYAFRRR